ncbi:MULTISPECIES: type IV secretion system protein VirB3 [Rhizobium]|uniref:Type IV secretion system protein VirB3 n=1 Tax=Rhizobium rhododendri TaxID=2506430 RepID=A0ABY8IRQ3_9HYPH|nr:MULTISPECIES: type IV secretion system protein VirB3 [Rhizobium]MBO9136606.1 type IV secretion system protein VirB3 [Rhizobium sp. B209b/85]MBZ5763493.1 type IV secretion system protein VirB3 [Rhizobium sp. VS19-DR96]MBZ5769435.1 type IV secretion system protein VirB3 [Rhizobium sp. VS19-DR129.2]MBZ5776988.1 type IV secretion system protein VirB3 [Rhizobium sp. VS19-DRK62.2]MBZ5788056.1 type IV secretion system protein VirB3 [Rhizobium sp. VS19-DR121]
MRERLEESTLYLAATRPALFLGVPLTMAGLFMMMAGFVIVIVQNPLYEMILIPLWLAARLIVERDYNAASVVLLFLQTAGRSVDGATWGGASVSPNPIKVPKRGRGIA